ncbi:hypothetical protein AGMMS49942_25600 [Spirochaetia bacterium]|nr:hypothetical protein AGMMS49942_25600 [Spirochaetia bacterium]
MVKKGLHRQENTVSAEPSIFFHPDYTVGTGISPVQSKRLVQKTLGVAGYTAGWDLHNNVTHYPTLKITRSV